MFAAFSFIVSHSIFFPRVDFCSKGEEGKSARKSHQPLRPNNKTRIEPKPPALAIVRSRISTVSSFFLHFPLTVH